MPDFDAMTVEEIEAYRIERRVQMRALREEILATKPAYHRKLALRALAATLRNPDIEFLSLEDANALLGIVAKNPREGDVVVEPGTNDELQLGAE